MRNFNLHRKLALQVYHGNPLLEMRINAQCSGVLPKTTFGGSPCNCLKKNRVSQAEPPPPRLIHVLLAASESLDTSLMFRNVSKR